MIDDARDDGFMEKTAEDLFKIAYQGQVAPDKAELVLKGLPKGKFTRLDINRFSVNNTAGYSTENCFVWFPSSYSGHLKSRIEFFIRSPLQNCSFFFFALPHKRSKLTFSLKGRGHTGVFFSANQMTFTARMVGQNNSLSIGENCYVGGAMIVLYDTTVTIGADGLWSDDILLQGSDSHGVVDLDTMETVNSGPTHITLKRHVWLGRRAIVTKNVTIDEGSIVATGAVVTKDVPQACSVAGIPAVVKKERVSWSRRLSGATSSEKRDLLKLRNKIDGIPDEPEQSTIARLIGKVVNR